MKLNRYLHQTCRHVSVLCTEQSRWCELKNSVIYVTQRNTQDKYYICYSHFEHTQLKANVTPISGKTF